MLKDFYNRSIFVGVILQRVIGHNNFHIISDDIGQFVFVVFQKLADAIVLHNRRFKWSEERVVCTRVEHLEIIMNVSSDESYVVKEYCVSASLIMADFFSNYKGTMMLDWFTMEMVFSYCCCILILNSVWKTVGTTSNLKFLFYKLLGKLCYGNGLVYC